LEINHTSVSEILDMWGGMFSILGLIFITLPLGFFGTDKFIKKVVNHIKEK